MNLNNVIGSAAVRWTAGACAVLSVSAAAMHAGSAWPSGAGITLAIAIVSGVLAFMAFVHASRAIYARWLTVASVMNKAVITALFGTCYIVVVPLFALLIWPFDVLRLRSRRDVDTYWVRKQNTRCDLASLQRMG
jgi:hypothetical protein